MNMKKAFLALALIFALGMSVNFVSAQEKSWTFMVYLDADNDLEGAGIADFLEMANAGAELSDDVNIVVQFDRAEWHDDSYGDWSDARRFLVTNGLEPITENAMAELGEIDMADPAELTEFIQWTKTNYPAENYALVLWNHGDGWRNARAMPSAGSEGAFEQLLPWEDEATESENKLVKGILADDSHGSYMSLAELNTALDGAGLSDAPLKILGFDACLMQMIEVAYQVKEYADIVVGSEETEPWDGWYYTPFLQNLVNNSAMTPAELAGEIVAAYEEYYVDMHHGWGDETLSAIDISKLDYVASKADALASTLLDNFDAQASNIQTARGQTHGFYDGSNIDLYDFAEKIGQLTNNSEIQSTATELMTVIDDATSGAVIAEMHGEYADGSHGIAVYYPPSPEGYSLTYTGTSFAQNTDWDEFISRDGYEPDNSDTEAMALVLHKLVMHSIYGDPDEDWMRFTIGSGNYILQSVADRDATVTVEVYSSTDLETPIASAIFEYSAFPFEGGEGIVPTQYIEELRLEDLPAGEYYLAVSGSEPCVYLLALSEYDSYESDNTRETAEPIIAGEPQDRSLHILDEDWAKFTAEAGVTYTIETQGPLDVQTDTVLYLYTSTGGVPIAADDDRSLYSKIIWTCEEPGEYYIQVQGYNSADGPAMGPYSLILTEGEVPWLALEVVSPVHEKRYNLPSVVAEVKTNQAATLTYSLQRCGGGLDYGWGWCDWLLEDQPMETADGLTHSAVLEGLTDTGDDEAYQVIFHGSNGYEDTYKMIRFRIDSSLMLCEDGTCSIYRELKKGWNLLSIPFTLANPTVGELLPADNSKVESVFGYQNGEWQVWHPSVEGEDAPANTLTALTGGRAYWVKANEDFGIIAKGAIGETIGNAPPVIPTLQLDSGWNLVGQYGTTDNYARNLFPSTLSAHIWTLFDGETPAIFGSVLRGVDYATGKLYLGQGYWVHLNSGFEFVPDDSLASQGE